MTNQLNLFSHNIAKISHDNEIFAHKFMNNRAIKVENFIEQSMIYLLETYKGNFSFEKSTKNLCPAKYYNETLRIYYIILEI